MTKQDKNLNNDLEINEIEDIEQEINEIEDKNEQLEKDNLTQGENWNDEVEKLKEQLARIWADYQNFKMRSDRDRLEMVWFLKHDILKKILPRVDDLERMIKNTPQDQKTWSLFEWVLILEKSLKQDLELLWVKPFESLWQEVDPNKHEVMTQIPSDGNEWKIIDEFEKGYYLWDKVLRVAKVVVGI